MGLELLPIVLVHVGSRGFDQVHDLFLHEEAAISTVSVWESRSPLIGPCSSLAAHAVSEVSLTVSSYRKESSTHRSRSSTSASLYLC